MLIELFERAGRDGERERQLLCLCLQAQSDPLRQRVEVREQERSEIHEFGRALFRELFLFVQGIVSHRDEPDAPTSSCHR